MKQKFAFVDERVVLVGVVEERDLREPHMLRKWERSQDALGVLGFIGEGGIGFDSSGVHGG